MNDTFHEEDVEEVYPLSPLQRGMVFHNLYGRQSGVDIEQLLAELPEELNVPAFQRAWRRLVDRHAILRTSFHWEERDEPCQQVHRNVRIHWELKDWRGLSGTEQKNRLDAYLEADRRRGFDLTLAPLMRLALMRVSDTRYWLVWSFHHLLIDGRTLVILFNELFAFYDAFCSGYELDLNAPTPYRDYVQWLQGQDLSKAQAFWREYLTGFTNPIVLGGEAASASAPLDANPQPADQQIQLSPAFTTALREVARQHDLTLNTLIQGAWALLLSRHSAQSDVVFGAIRAGRRGQAAGAESIAGMTINTVPVRVNVRMDLSLIEWLKQVREQWIALRPFEHTPLMKIQEWSEVPRGQPLFEILLNVQDPSWDEALRSQDSRWRRRHFSVKSQPNFPLAVDVYGGRALVVKMWYNQRRFADELIGRLLGHLKRMLEGMVENLHRRVGELPWLTEAERQQLLVEWNQTTAEFPNDRSVLERFEEQMTRRPNALAVASDEDQINYQELNRRAGQIGLRLRCLGVKPEEVVGVCVGRSSRMVTAMLGVWKAGGAYVPMDPSYPEERLAYMIADAGMRAVLTERSLADRLPAKGVKLICLDELEHENPAESETEVYFRNPGKLHTLAYVIYTSGSTGRPKGVEVAHRSLMNLVAWHQRTYRVAPEDRATQIAGIGYDACVWEVWPYLAAGASVFIASEKTRVSPRELIHWLAKHRITISFLSTPLAHAVMDESWPTDLALRALLTGGEKLHRRPNEKFPSALLNHYGPTENTVVTTWTPVEPGAEAAAPIPIGRPVTNSQVYVLDSALDPVAVGVPGELYIAGASLARGYRRQPDLTAERFVPNPFSNEPGDRLYRTGDLVRFLPDGRIDFLGRIDQQVKIRGNRVELGEIESVLNQHDDVREAAVAVRRNDRGENWLAAYVAPKRERSVTPQQLREFLRRQLPDYMVPSAFVMLSALPLTANGKVNRDALPAPDQAQQREAEIALPRTPTEEALAAIWEELLSVKRVGIHDNFFNLGGHSMLATQVVSRIYRLFQCELPVGEVFEFPTVAALGERIDLVNRGMHEAQPLPLTPRAQAGLRPLSFAQERLWFLEQLEPGQAFNNVPVAAKLEGPLDVEALKSSLTEIARRHETLRTRFETVREQPSAHVVPDPLVPLSEFDLSEVPPTKRSDELERLITAEAGCPFDLTQGPLWRANLFRLGENEHCLMLNLHHTISDGWSLGVLLHELKTLYEAALTGRPATCPALPIQYSDYAAWQREWMQGEALEAQLSYWKQHLGRPPLQLNLPTDRPRPSTQSYRGAKVFFALPTALAKALRQLSRREDVTPFMLLLAAFQTLLHRYSGQEDITVGTPIAGRRRIETEALIGFFANTLVLRGDLSGDPTVRQLLKRVRRVALDAYAHQDIPFEKLVDALQPERDLSHSPLFQVMFIFQRRPMASMEMAGVRLSPRILDNGTSKFDLTLSLEETEENDLSGFVEFDVALFDRSTIVRLLSHYQTLLESMAANPDQPVSKLELLAPGEKQQLLVQWNATQSRYDQRLLAPRMIREKAEQNPETTAVVCGTQRLSYAELNARADAFAGHLRALGVGPETLAGIFMDPSLETIVALLATLKAGGAYLPLDPTYPKERLAFMLEDAGPLVVLTQKNLLGNLPPFRGSIVCVDEFSTKQAWPVSHAKLPAGALQRECEGLHPENLAYVIYTSGSTGKPKGVGVSHRALTNFLQAMRDKLEVSPSDVLLAVTTLSFDIAGLEIYLPLISGARLVLTSREETADGAQLARKISDSGATIMQATPATWRLLLDSGWRGNAALKILCGGEGLPRPLANALHERGAILWNLYGPTETTVWSLAQRVEPGEGPVPIGRPIANTQVYILDPHHQPVPVGVPGELYLGGDGVARGYLNREDLTAERFVPGPAGEHFPGRIYRTGDLARYLSDGRIEFLGRIDHQVKLRGHRIELGEIEAALLRHPAVREAVVVLGRPESGHDRLVAYVTNHAPRSVSFHELRDFLQLTLPTYMIPSVYVLLDAFPLTPNGKIDRRALPVPSRSVRTEPRKFAPPKTDLEKVLSEIWARLFELDRVGVQDNFFKLGGHSLLAVQLIARIRAAFKIDLALRTLFEAPTIKQLARTMIQREPVPGQIEKLAELIAQVKGLTTKPAAAIAKTPLKPRSSRRITRPIASSALQTSVHHSSEAG